MNKHAVALICATGLGVPGLMLLIPSLAQSPSDTERELLTIQKQWADARVKPDIAYLERLYAQEFRVQGMTGAVASRADDIAMFREGRIKPEFVRDEDMNVSVYGETAVVTGVENVAGRYPSGPLKGQRAELSLRFSNVFVHRDGRWQLVLHQSTQIPQTQPQSTEADTVAHIKKLENERIQAGVRKDIALIDAATADEYVQIDWDGKVLDKAATLARIRSSTIQLQSNTIDNLDVKVYGTIAIVNGRATRKGTMDGRDISTAIRYTRVYANREGRWQVVQFQQTRVAQDNG